MIFFPPFLPHYIAQPIVDTPHHHYPWSSWLLLIWTTVKIFALVYFFFIFLREKIKEMRRMSRGECPGCGRPE
jgi:hypothetical protein